MLDNYNDGVNVMIVFNRYVLKFDELKDMFNIYFKDEERNVQLSYDKNEKNEPIIRAKETIDFNGEVKTFDRVMTNEEIEEIIYTFFARAGFEEIDVVHYGAAGTKVKDGLTLKTVTNDEAHQYIVVTRQKQNTKF